MVWEADLAVTSVVETERYDHDVSDNRGELSLRLVNRVLGSVRSNNKRAYGRSHAPTFQITGQAINVVVFATDNVPVGIKGFPFKSASVST